jgi:hypothetical protein
MSSHGVFVARRSTVMANEFLDTTALSSAMILSQRVHGQRCVVLRESDRLADGIAPRLAVRAAEVGIIQAFVPRLSWSRFSRHLL